MKGEVVIIPFPFSDLSGAKRRPALVIADWNADDIILCQITSKLKQDGYEIKLTDTIWKTARFLLKATSGLTKFLQLTETLLSRLLELFQRISTKKLLNKFLN